MACATKPQTQLQLKCAIVPLCFTSFNKRLFDVVPGCHLQAQGELAAWTYFRNQQNCWYYRHWISRISRPAVIEPNCAPVVGLCKVIANLTGSTQRCQNISMSVQKHLSMFMYSVCVMSQLSGLDLDLVERSFHDAC